MKRKYLSSLLFLSSVCLSLVSCDNEKGGTKKGLELYYAYSTENLLSDWDYLDYDEEDDFMIEQNQYIYGRDHTLRYNLMQNENDAMQLMIRPTKYVNEFDFELPTLHGANGAEISKDNFSVSAAWYQEVTYSLEQESMTGFYPDALIPLEKYKWRRMNHIEKERNQSLFINFKSTTDMTPGFYTGTGKLTLDSETYDIPFEVTIYDAVMPDEVHWKSSYLIWYEEIVNGERENTNDQMYMNYFNFVVDHRMSPDQFPSSLQGDPATYANSIYEYVANNPKISSARIPLVGGSLSYEQVYDKAYSFLEKIIDKNLAVIAAGDTDCDMFDKLFFYIDDEPTSGNYPLVRAHDKAVYDVKLALKSRLNAYPTLQNSFMHIENIVTLQFTDELVATSPDVGGIQTWCPQYQHFNTPEQRANYKERQNSSYRECGENVWWYGCMDPASPFPSNHLDANLILGRCMPWMQYAYDVEANIYWNVCYYSKQTVHAKMGRDIWYDPMTWISCAGDGALVYPGIDFGIRGPIPTLRIESILASAEDYEYLWMIEQKVNEYNTLHSTNLDAKELLQKYFSRLFVNVFAYTDTNEFDAVSIEVLKVCEKLNKNLDEGIALLQA